MSDQSDSRKAKLVSALWELKNVHKHNDGKGLKDIHFIHFNSMLEDEKYRNEIIARSLLSPNDKVRAAGTAAHSLNLRGNLRSVARASGQDFEKTGVLDSDTQAALMESIASAKRGGGAKEEAVPLAPHSLQKRSRVPLIGGILALFVALFVGSGMVTGDYTWFLKGNTEEVSGSIFDHTVWTADREYHLLDTVYVESGGSLTIEPGTRILGHPGSALIVTRDAAITARGTDKRPIVFTSVKPAGQRRRGDWGGVVLLGNAPVNTGTGHIEGIAEDDPRGNFGGNAESDNCGMLQYVRIEFAGAEFSADNELNGLTLGGCGSGTLLRFIQVHMGLDDGIEFFGGTANLKNVLITRPGDDGLDWDRGWRGNGQFIIVQLDSQDGDNAIEADNYKKDHNASPRSLPRLSNVTLVGSHSKEIAQRAMVLRRGTGADLRNFIISGFPKETIDIRDASTAALLETGELKFSGFLLADSGLGASAFPAEEGESDDDGGFDERAWFLDEQGDEFAFARRSVLPQSAYTKHAPGFIPESSSPAAQSTTAVSQGEFWDEAANYQGAIRPGNRVSWIHGWTAFPEN